MLQLLKNFSSPKGIRENSTIVFYLLATIRETIVLSNGVEIKVEYSSIKKDDNTSEPGKINVVAINKKVGK